MASRKQNWKRLPGKAEVYQNGKGNQVVLAPPCSKCENEPRCLIVTRATGDYRFWGLGRECENESQRINRAKKKARGTLIEEIGLSKAPVAAFKKNGVETVADLMEIQGELVELDGIGKKTVDHVTQYLGNLKLA